MLIYDIKGLPHNKIHKFILKNIVFIIMDDDAKYGPFLKAMSGTAKKYVS